MHTEAINQIKKRSTTILKVLNVITWIIIIFFAIYIGLVIWAGFLPAESFHAKSGVAYWSINVNMFGTSGLSTRIPFSILQSFRPEIFQAKTAFIIFTLFSTFTLLPVLLYGIKQVKCILETFIDSYTPFTLSNSNKLRNLAFTIIGYGLFGKLIVNLAVALFVTHRVSITFFEIFDIFIIMCGALVFIISHIFKYGAYLQEEVDTTL